MSDETDELNQKLKALRNIAEEKLVSAELGTKLESIAMPVDLLHELRVHQIELKMQNEELRRTQAALEESRNHYLELYDFSPVGYLTLNPEGVILEINLSASKLLGIDRKEIINRRFAKFIHDDYKDLWYRHFLTAKQNPTEQHGCELPFSVKSGNNAYYHINCNYSEEEGEVASMRVTLTDVTQRKLFEEELRIAAAAFHTHEAVIVADKNWVILRVNRAFTRITGFSAEEVIGRPSHHFQFTSQQDEGFYDAVWEAIRREGFWQGIVWKTRKDGEPIALSLTVTSVFDDRGGVSHYVATFSDITERLQIEAKVNELTNDFTTFLENTSDIVYYKGADNKYRFCSNSLAKFLGLADWHDLIGKEPRDFYPEELATICDESTDIVFSKGVPLINELEPYTDKAGNQGWLNTSKWPQFNDKGKVIGVFGISRDVTVQQKIERELRWSEELNRKTFQAFHEHIAVIDEQGIIMSVNEAWANFARKHSTASSVGLSIGVNYLETCRQSAAANDEDAKYALAGIEAILRGDTDQFSMEYPCHTEQQNYWFFMSVVPLILDGVVGAVIAHQDVTERKQNEIALRESEARYRQLLESQTDIICRYQAGHTILYVNEAFCKMFGKSREALLGHKWHPVVYPDDLPGLLDKLKAISPGNPILTVENRIIGAKGKIHWVQFVNRGFFGQDGSLLEVQAVGRDITERKRAEEALRIAAAAFETQTGIIVTDADEVILNVNKAFTRITGYPAKEVIGKTPSMLHSGFQNQGFYDDLWAAVDKDNYWEGEIWDKRKDGQVFPLWQSITAVIDENGKTTHYVGSFTDISVQKHAEKVLLEARSRLENQVANTQEELDKIKTETKEINTALNVLLKQRETDKNGAQLALSDEVEATVLPLLKKLRTVSSGRLQSLRLIKILEENLLQLTKSYGRGANLASVYQKLTPIETQVAAMIRQGHPTKVIAAALNIAEGTVSIHRKHIRRKLGLSGKSDNLYSYLMSLIE